MRARMWGAAAAFAALACAPGKEQPERLVLEQGRQYTTWLYGNQYDKLWNRFSPEMRQTFGSVTDLASFASRAVTRMGREQGAVDERVERAEPFGVYSRSASFDNAPEADADRVEPDRGRRGHRAPAPPRHRAPISRLCRRAAPPAPPRGVRPLRRHSARPAPAPPI